MIWLSLIAKLCTKLRLVKSHFLTNNSASILIKMWTKIINHHSIQKNKSKPSLLFLSPHGGIYSSKGFTAPPTSTTQNGTNNPTTSHDPAQPAIPCPPPHNPTAAPFTQAVPFKQPALNAFHPSWKRGETSTHLVWFLSFCNCFSYDCYLYDQDNC